MLRNPRVCVCLVVFALSFTPVAVAQDKEVDRLEDAGRVLQEITGMPEGLPTEWLDKAECVVVLPSVKKFAIGLGGSYGRGAMSCRSGAQFSGPWSPPVMMALEGGSYGLQLGGEATDFVLLLMNPRAAGAVLKSKVKLGATASAVAGPKGREASAATDATLRAEILSYSRSRGLFAGISLEGSTLRPDGGANKNIYGRKIRPRSVIQQAGPGSAKSAALMINTLNKVSPSNKSDADSLKSAPPR